MGGREAIIPPLLAPARTAPRNHHNNPNNLLLELDEGDVVWPQTTSNSHSHSHSPPSSSSSSSSSLPSNSLSPSPSPSPSHSPRPKLGLALGLSAALFPDPLPLLPRQAPAAVAVPPIRPSSPSDQRPFLSGGGRPLQMSVPVNVPVWPGRRRYPPEGDRDRRPMIWDLQEGEEKEDDEEDGGRTMVPPHVLAARSRAMSFSVFEGVGRTLKGRDLRQVRNAVLQKTGFLD